MTRKPGRILPGLCLAVFILSTTLLPTAGYGESLRFIFLADSPGSSLSQPVSTPVLNAIVSKILQLSPQPWAVFVGGDLALLADSRQFRSAMKPLTDSGIKLYTALGNHELFSSATGEFFLADQTAFQLAYPDNPNNGPTGYEHLAYSLTSPGGDAFFAVLDPYYLTADVPSPDLSGSITDAQLSWLSNQIAGTQATHKFLFIHTPFSYIDVQGSSPEADEPANSDDTFTSLWTILDNNQFDIYFCGHQHLYSRKAIDSNTTIYPSRSTPKWTNTVVQLICGTCGAAILGGDPVNANGWHVSNSDNTYYFSVVDINGSNVAVHSYSGNQTASDYAVFDSFAINKDSSLLWAGTGGYAAPWIFDSSNNLRSSNTYGPYNGWTPVSYTFNPDGTATLLWSGTGGYACIWTLDSSSNYLNHKVYGPYSGWTPVSYSYNPDAETGTLLWSGTGGSASIWTLDGSNDYLNHKVYGPYSGWTPVSYSYNPDAETGTLVWSEAGGSASIWTLDSSNNYLNCKLYGPYNGWTPVNYSFNSSTGTGTLLWSETGGSASIWTLDSSNNYLNCKLYGPYKGWTPVNYSFNSSTGTGTLLWSETGGSASVWTLDSSNNYSSYRLYGPYSGWAPIQSR